MFDNQNVILNELHNTNNMEKMIAHVVTSEPNSSIFDVLAQMQQKFLKRIVIVEDGKPVGIVTERDINQYLEQDKTSKSIKEIPIKHVMKKNIIATYDGQDDHLQQCAIRMETFRIGSVILIDNDGKLIGILSRTDITKAFAAIFADKFHVKEFMNEKLITCRETDTLKFALNMLNRNHISRLVVTDENGKPVGIITTNDFLKHSDFFTREDDVKEYLISGNADEACVRDLIKTDLVTIEQGEDLAKAASLMVDNKISGIPVLDENQNLVGIIDKSDIVIAFNHVKNNDKLSREYGFLH